MSLLNQVVKGKIEEPDFLTVYGPDGVGKSTFGANAPEPIFLGAEKGTSRLNTSRYPKQPKTYQDIMDAIQDLTDNPHPFKTLNLDSLDWMEPLVWDKVCADSGTNKIEFADGGYGKGYTAATTLWEKMIANLQALREKRKMHIIAIAHAEVKTFNDPQQQSSYDRYQLKLHKHAAAKWREASDCVLFMNHEVYTKEDKTKKTRAYGEGVRLMFTERRPGYDAKNRFGLPPVLALDYAVYEAAKNGSNPAAPEALMSQITELLGQVKDLDLRKKVEDAVKAANGDTSKLMVYLNRLRTLMSQ